eukprot:6604803-Pyramimonas_sp.AAC.1
MNLETLLCANGVGSGAAISRAWGTFSLSRNYQHPDEPPTAKVNEFVVYVAEGCGSDLPAIHGLASAQSKRAVLILEEGKGRIIFSGPHAYEVHPGKGAQ